MEPENRFCRGKQSFCNTWWAKGWVQAATQRTQSVHIVVQVAIRPGSLFVLVLVLNRGFKSCNSDGGRVRSCLGIFP